MVDLIDWKVGFGVEVAVRFVALTPYDPESGLAQRVVVVKLALSKVLHEAGRGSIQGFEVVATLPSTQHLSH